MEAVELRLVGDVAPAGGPARRPAAALLVAGAALAAGVLATGFGADAARHRFDAREIGAQAMRVALERGSDDPQVHDAAVTLRRALGRRPLDSRTRVAYAGLLLVLAQHVDDAPAAAFHASRAAALSPVTFPVVRNAALVLARAGQAEEAGPLVREMFTYEAPGAARLLAQIEPLMQPGLAEQLVPDDAQAWLAWASELRTGGRADEADRWLARAHARFRGDLRVLEQVAARAARRRDYETLAAVLADRPDLPDERGSAPILLYRAQLAVARHDPAAARRDVASALRLDGGARKIRVMAGEVYDALGDYERARREWNRALSGMAPGDSPTHRLLLLYLARLEDRHGRPDLAVRLWKQLLALDPQHAEARRRVDDLSGFRR